MLAHLELQIILEAKERGEEYVELPVVQGETTSSMSFCGMCGRVVHHPNCPRVTEKSS